MPVCNRKTRIDHLVVAAADLSQGIAYIKENLGVDIAYGGAHAQMGTHNHLLQLGDSVFLEVISVNPDMEAPKKPRWYGLDDPFVRRQIEAQPTLLTWVVNTHVAENETLYRGVRDGDWFFSENKEWILPHDQVGLSFSSTYKNLKDVYRLKGRWNPGTQIDIHWVLERPDLPAGFKFVADREKKGHYFLTVTEPMLLYTLISKLKILARQMSIIRSCR